MKNFSSFLHRLGFRVYDWRKISCSKKKGLEENFNRPCVLLPAKHPVAKNPRSAARRRKHRRNKNLRGGESWLTSNTDPPIALICVTSSLTSKYGRHGREGATSDGELAMAAVDRARVKGIGIFFLTLDKRIGASEERGGGHYCTGTRELVAQGYPTVFYFSFFFFRFFISDYFVIFLFVFLHFILPTSRFNYLLFHSNVI